MLGDLGEVAARERAAEEGDGQRVGVGIGDADAQGRPGADAGAPSAGAFSVGESGAPLPAGGTKPGTQVGAPTAAPVLPLPELSARLVPLPSLRFQTPSSPVCGR